MPIDAKLIAAFLIVALATATLTIIGMNFMTGERKVEERIQPRYAVADPQFLRSMGTLLGPSIKGGNRVEALTNGDEIFPEMLRAIRSATRTITFETFIYWSGSIGKEFADALSERARAGVKVHVLLDWLGSGKIDPSLLQEMKASGVHLQMYHPLRWYTLSRMNNRTHRKILVVDGKIGFTGGVGIADPWLGHAQDPDHWRDTHFRMDGPAVGELQAAFMDNWLKTEGEVLHGEEYFPEVPPSGDALAQVFTSSASGGAESARLMYLMSIASARRSVRVSAAYFVPDDLSVETLLDARKRGVVVEIILPGDQIDARVVRKASRARWGALLRAGVEIYEYVPTMYHCKVMIVDDLWVSVGSTNFDSRSFRLNDEANLNVFDEAFARAQVAHFEADRGKARRVTLQAWEDRPWTEKVAEHAAALLRSQL